MLAVTRVIAVPRVLIVRGHLVTPWELRPWAELPERFEVSYLLTDSNRYSAEGLGISPVPVRSLRDRLPAGRDIDRTPTSPQPRDRARRLKDVMGI